MVLNVFNKVNFNYVFFFLNDYQSKQINRNNFFIVFLKFFLKIISNLSNYIGDLNKYFFSQFKKLKWIAR